MNFCSQCGASVSVKIPAGDTLPRHVCEACGKIHYSNPLMVIGCIPEWEDRILLCKRAIEPRLGLWTLPAGFMENGETTAEAARRETLEEANARVEVGDLYCYLNIPRIDQVYVMFLARLLDLDFSPGAESLEVSLLGRDEVPWSEIAFPSIEITLRHFFDDRERGAFPTRVFDVERRRG